MSGTAAHGEQIDRSARAGVRPGIFPARRVCPPGFDILPEKHCPVGILQQAMADNRSELLQGTLDLLMLQMLETAGPMHGWGLAQRLQNISHDAFVLNQGSLYPALHRLEARGWIEAEWGVSDANRQAKFYRLTRAGRKQLAEETNYWEHFVASVGLVLRGN